MTDKANREAVPASLVGSLAVFELSQILSLLSATERQGELQVVGGGLDGRLWVDHGALTAAAVGSSRTVSEAVFELSLLEEGWFYFTQGVRAPVEGEPEVIGAVLDTVRPQVDEWRQLLRVLPLEATVRLAPTTPHSEVHIRAEQWQVLTLLGNAGLPVSAVVAALPQEQVVSLRVLEELVSEGLVLVEEDENMSGDDAGGTPGASNGYGSEAMGSSNGNGPGSGNGNGAANTDGAASGDGSQSGPVRPGETPPPFQPGWKVPSTAPSSSRGESSGSGEYVPDNDVTVIPPADSSRRREPAMKGGRR